jgi:hypothetical protein
MAAGKEEKLHRLYVKIVDEKELYNDAYYIFTKKNSWLVMPTIILTSFSSMLSFITSSDVVPSEQKKILLIGVGVLTSIASIFQSLSTAFAYNVKAEMFRKAADSYDKLITNIQFEIDEPNEDDFLQKMEEKILAIKNECKFLPPPRLTKVKNEPKFYTSKNDTASIPINTIENKNYSNL